MVNLLKHAVVWTAVLLHASPRANGVEPLSRSHRLPPIAVLTVTANGVRSTAAPEDDSNCRAFKLSEKEARDFLTRARAVSQHDYLHLLDWSPCHATGTVQYKNGVSGIWGIHQWRAGSIKLSDGRELYLTCPTCRAKAFLPR